jgi:phosphohistidine phosphatase
MAGLPELQQVVVLVRHGDAKDKTEDPARPLSDVGRNHAETAARWLAGLGLDLDEIRHSGKLRARQTAEVCAAHLGLAENQVRQVSGLAPNDDVEQLALELEADRRSLLLAGHLPFLARLAGRLLVAEAGRLPIHFSDAAAMVLARIEGSWHLVAFAGHEVLPE